MDTKYKYLIEHSGKTIFKVIFNIKPTKLHSQPKSKALLSLIIYWYLNPIENRGLFLFCALKNNQE